MYLFSGLPRRIEPKRLLESLLGQFLRTTPFILQSLVLEKLLNQLFAQEIAEGDLDCLQDRYLKVHINDWAVGCRVSLHGQRLAVFQLEGQADATISGHAREYGLLLSRQEDPDTLFFQRRLMIGGDTELGLEIKNLLDAVDYDSQDFPLKQILMSTSQMSRWLFQERAE